MSGKNGIALGVQRTKPSWVSQWAWTQCTQLVEKYWASGPDSQKFPNAAELEKFAFALMKNRDCAIVWRAIEARKGFFEAHWEALYSKYGVGAPLNEHNVVARLLEWLFYMVKATPEPQDLVPRSARKRVAKKIAKACAVLTECLQELRVDDGPLPSQIRIGLTKAAFEFTFEQFEKRSEQLDDTSRLSQNKRSAAPSEISTAENDNDLPFKSAMLSTESAFLNVDFIINELSKAVANWSETSPVVVQPRQPNAQRLFFIKSLTQYFKHFYGAPLREQTAALVRALYDCEMTASTVKNICD